jgi:hypothetical protein
MWEVGETLVSFYGKRGVHRVCKVLSFLSFNFMDTLSL